MSDEGLRPEIALGLRDRRRAGEHTPRPRPPVTVTRRGVLGREALARLCAVLRLERCTALSVHVEVSGVATFTATQLLTEEQLEGACEAVASCRAR